MSHANVEREIEALGPWFHNLHLPGGIQTCPNHFLGDFPRFKYEAIAPHLPARMDGWRVLDVGCNAGFYSLALAGRGAEVLAVDVDARYLAQARWAAERAGLAERVRLEERQVYDLATLDETFDLVWFMGVFYHLRYPLLALDILRQKVGRLMVFQTFTMPGGPPMATPENIWLTEREQMERPGWPKMAFIEHRLNDDPTNWWAPSHAAVEAMLRSTGLRVTARPTDETYLCVPDASLEQSFWLWNEREYRAATGGLR